MATMTDYISKDEMVQEEQIDILESYMQLQASFTLLDTYYEYATIYDFCKSAECEIPSIVQEAYDSISDAVTTFLDNVFEWFCGLVRGFNQNLAKSRISKLIAIIDTCPELDSKTIKLDKKYRIDANYMEYILMMMDDFALLLNKIEDGELKDSKSREYILEGLKDIEKYKSPTNELKNEIVELYKSKGKMTSKKLSEEELKMPLSELKAELLKINELNLPNTGSKILSRMKYKKNKTKKNAEFDKETHRAIQRAANSIARIYDAGLNDLGKTAEALFNEAKESSSLSSEKLRQKAEEINYAGKYNSKTRNNGRDQSKPLSSATSLNRQAIKVLTKTSSK